MLFSNNGISASNLKDDMGLGVATGKEMMNRHHSRRFAPRMRWSHDLISVRPLLKIDRYRFR
ncbi:hypothetical protein A0U93_09995 [Neoasaia chiangmaiensis]|uniref:Uncharacterized protein n=1 Tax=Neoasaia chiangmaiensis TaxID=320497 RepID=A0A1U9KR60_9PROT|nr:hypothetical protein A0U93_09995 [Neoasaia chiangmaiensis]